MSTAAVAGPKIVSEKEWLAARKALLAKEKEFSRQRDAMAALRREMPWVKVEKSYVFEGPNGKVSLADLFAGRSQLIIYHFMLGPDWKEGCPGCSFLADTFDGAVPHLAARDTSFVAVSRAPLAQILPFQKRMGWKFRWVSSSGTSFNYDYRVSFTKEERDTGSIFYNYGPFKRTDEEHPGASVFHKNAAGEIFHTYSTYARGLDIMLAAYNWLDITPKGRDEANLGFPMAWVRHHDKYDHNYVVDPSVKTMHHEAAGHESAPTQSAKTSSCCEGH
jgi:predicted dithiol-disulfide oxidoreductase (DUF899 family)